MQHLSVWILACYDGHEECNEAYTSGKLMAKADRKCEELIKDGVWMEETISDMKFLMSYQSERTNKMMTLANKWKGKQSPKKGNGKDSGKGGGGEKEKKLASGQQCCAQISCVLAWSWRSRIVFWRCCFGSKQ